MNNEPVAWMELYFGEPNNLAWSNAELKDSGDVYKTIPLYTHQAKELNAGGEPVKNATYWKRQYNEMSALNDRLKSSLYHANEQIKYLESYSAKTLIYEDLTLILEVLIDSYDDTNRCYLEYEAIWKNSPTRKAKLDGMKRMVDKHTHAIEMVEAILKKAQEK